jgi:uncharacterized protein
VPRVVAVSVSVPRVTDIRGRAIHTSIVRDAHPGPVMFGLGGPISNRTAVHTEDVLGTTAENYDYWTSELGVARAAWPDCFWGENLMVSGLSENALRIGDRLHIGPTAVLEVTSPRIPCFKLAWRLGQPDTFLRTLVESGRTGFYMRVRVPGKISAGAPIVVNPADQGSIAVADLSRLLHDDTAAVDSLRLALTTPGLGSQASAMLRNRITQLDDGIRCRRGRWQGWRPFVVADIAAESAEVRSFTLRPQDGGEVAQYRAGQFLAVRLRDRNGTHMSRAWSISDYSEEERTYRLTIRRAPDGRGSMHMHDAIKIGHTLDVRTPAGAFVLDRSTVFRIALISAGIGVTPMLSMLKAHAARNNAPPLLWIHSTRNGTTHVLREEAQRVIRANPQFKSHIAYTSPGPAKRAGLDFDEPGRLTPERLATLVGPTYRCQPFGRDIELPGTAGLFYICGAEAFENDVRSALLALGVDAAAIYSESFGRGVIDDSGAIEECEVRFARSLRTVTWRREMDLSLLELAEQHGLMPDASCRAGSCHTCETGIIAGKVRYELQPPVSPSSGRVLICCGRPASARLELDL